MGRFFLPGLIAGAPREPAGFNARREQSRLAEVVVRCAATLVASDADAQALIERKCQLLTTMAPHIVLAWTWFGPPKADRLRPQAVAGAASEYARALVIERTPLTQVGPAFRTLAGKRLEPFNVSTMSLYGPWRAAARDHGVRSVLALPLASFHDEQRGLFVLYSDVPDYFDLVGIGMFEALAQLFSAVLSRAARNAELAQAAHRDPLTGLHNRAAMPLLTSMLLRTTAADPPAAVLMIDIDRFKQVNDEHGHATGDAALRHAARCLQGSLRRGDALMRWGGEEFAVALADATPAQARAVAEKLRVAIETSPLALEGGGRLQLTASVGVAQLAAGEAVVEALGRADAALYAAKRAGRNRVETAEPAA